ncbi:MAG: Gfo/Idh/MocA family oxidoreductase [Catenulispora sp.]|nr:Gfo/Idh/MocA family oxidoreductase [Catenulispora sp.]
MNGGPEPGRDQKPVSVGLVGARGHGLHHRRRLTAQHDSGLIRWVAVCDVVPVDDVPDGVAAFTDHREMLRAVRPDIVIVCTPPHTHTAIAVDCLQAGADVLLEKPPVLTLAEHETLLATAERTGRSLQIGFQALGSAALPLLHEAIDAGRLGEIRAVSAFGSWQRDDAYWARSSWSGRRGIDGALANPFAHALMQCIAVLRPPKVAKVEVERLRARPIEVDDTAAVRATFEDGSQIVVAVTLCGEDFLPGEVVVHGSTGTAHLEYPTDRLCLPGAEERVLLDQRTDLLLNLAAHRADPGIPLVAPLAATATFTAMLEHIRDAPEPYDIAPDRLVRQGGAVVVSGINHTVREAAFRLALLSDIDPQLTKDHR